ncbi:4657_t:CDS:2, partial [Scutellospora calospora]
MPHPRLTGPCAINNCNSQVNSIRNIIQDLIDKIEKCLDFSYDYLKVNEDQICFEHYMNIVNFITSQSSNNKKSKTWIDLGDLIEITQQKSFSNQLQLLTKTLYKYEDKNNDYLLDSDCFKQLIETEEPQLIGFLDEMTNALQQIISQCYLLAGLRNQNINKYKTDLSLYLSSCSLSSTGIDFLMRAGIMISSKTLYNFKEKIKNNHLTKINEYFTSHLNIFHCFNINNFHEIHELRQPNNTTLSSANHLATFLAISNRYSFFNPKNIEPTRKIINLMSKYNGCFDKSYNKCKMEWIFQNIFQFNSQNRIDLLTLYIYDNAIKEHKEERSMK